MSVAVDLAHVKMSMGSEGAAFLDNVLVTVLGDGHNLVAILERSGLDLDD